MSRFIIALLVAWVVTLVTSAAGTYFSTDLDFLAGWWACLVFVIISRIYHNE